VLTTDLDAYSRWSMDTLFKLPNVKDIHTSFSLGEIKAGARCHWATCVRRPPGADDKPTSGGRRTSTGRSLQPG